MKGIQETRRPSVNLCGLQIFSVRVYPMKGIQETRRPSVNLCGLQIFSV